MDMDQEQLGLLHTILKRHIPDKTVWAYGSRVNWKAGETSDLDLAVFGCASMEISDLKEALEESDLLISVDVIDWESIPDDFKENIRRKYVVLQERPSKPESWREVTLGDVAYFKTGKLNSNEGKPNGIYPFFTCSPETSSIDKYAFDEEAILLAGNNANGIFPLKYYNGKFNAYQRTYIINIDRKNCDYKFIFYVLKKQLSNLEAISHGTATKYLTLSILNNITDLIPSLLEQKAIAEVLSSLDDKIDLLHRQNKTLEDMAQTLFRKWFVEDKDERWKVFSLYDAIELVGGGTPSTSVPEYWGGEIGWVSGRDVAANHKGIISSAEKSISVEGLKNSSAKLIPRHSTVISARGTVGKYCILLEPMAFSQSNYGIKPKLGDAYFFTYLLIDFSIDELQSAAYGSVFDTITTDTFRGHSVKLPQVNVIQEFEIEVTPLFEKMISNQSQIQILENLRDALLPKLMSGKVRMKFSNIVDDRGIESIKIVELG